jgi:hypothetical protein
MNQIVKGQSQRTISDVCLTMNTHFGKLIRSGNSDHFSFVTSTIWLAITSYQLNGNSIIACCREFSPIFELVAATLVVRKVLEHIFQSQYRQFSSTNLGHFNSCLLNKLLNV